MPRYKSSLAHYLNNVSYSAWLNRLYNIAISCHEWLNVPDTVNTRFLEQTLFWKGSAVWFEDFPLGQVALPVTNFGPPDIYGEPVTFGATSHGYTNNDLNQENAVIIYNNLGHTPDLDTMILYAQRLSAIDRAIDVNVARQKTPWVLNCDESERLTIVNALKKVDENEPAIFGTKRFNMAGALNSISLTAPFVSADLMGLKRQILMECLTYFGVEANTSSKAERLVTPEIEANLGETEANRQSRVVARQDAAKKINRIFGGNVQVRFRSELQLSRILEGVEKDVDADNSSDAI